MGFFRSIFVINDKNNSNGDGASSGSKTITNRELMKKLSEVFVDYIERESLGQRMIFPMSFNVLMHRHDYNSRKETLHLVLPEVISNFYSIIRQKSREYPNCIPPADYWFFQFSPTLVDSLPLENGEVLQIKPGNPAIAASLLNNSGGGGEDSNVSVENNVSVSVSCLNSNVYSNANLNIKTLVGVDMISEGVFRFKFDMKPLEEVKSATPVSTEVKSSYATLKYQKDGKVYCYTMRDSQVSISGISEAAEVRSVFKVESDKVAEEHVVVRYLESENKFQIAANGPAKLNGNSMKVSASGELEWRDLANKSRIFINDAITVHFEKLV